MRRIRGFYVSEEEKGYLERYLTVIRECTEDQVKGATYTVDAYYGNLEHSKKAKEV